MPNSALHPRRSLAIVRGEEFPPPMKLSPAHTRFPRAASYGVALTVALGLSACGEPQPSLTEAMAKADQDPDIPTPTEPRDPPSLELDGPTEAEFKAWNRKDPEGEKHLYKWDKQNLPRMWNYWKELHCFRDKMREEGQKAFGAEPQSPEDEQWYQFKRVFIPFLDLWQQRLFANEPRILEKSKLIGHFLEGHELVMNGYPIAFNNSDETELRKQDAHWLLVNDKVTRYLEQIGGGPKYKMPDVNNPKEAKEYEKFCDKALHPKPEKGAKKIKGKKSPI